MNKSVLWVSYGAVILLGAFLLFLIEPVTGKIVTPKFGGTSGIWSACILFFQLTLLGGYLLTYLLNRLPLKWQSVVYLSLFALSILWAHIPTAEAWIPNESQPPILSLLLLMLQHLALPCILLSSVSGMLQNWFRVSGMENPYPLYGVSNIGSLGALLVYPFILEPHFTLPITLHGWMIAYWVCAAGMAICAVFMWQRTKGMIALEVQSTKVKAPINKFLFLGWIILSTAGSVLLLGFTTSMTHDIAPVPLLWVIPLAVYLYTFVLCFSQGHFYHRPLYLGLAQLLLILYLAQAILPLPARLLLYMALLFVLCMICHGELVLRKPQAEKLPVFYLAVAVGGAIGGVLVNVIAPLVFNAYWELPITLIFMAVLSVVLTIRYDITLFYNRWVHRIFQASVFAILMFYVAGLFLFKGKQPELFTPLLEVRNFYGTAAIKVDKAQQFKGMFNGTILHGGESMRKGEEAKPFCYYHAQSAAALAFDYLHQQLKDKPIDVGIIGLGTGTMATYGRAQDNITFFELDPKVTQLAKQQFKFLRASKSHVQIVMGDGRLTLAKSPERYDLLMVDAFSSDAIPIHLLTRQAFDLYQAHLKPGGIMLFHISNRYLNLAPVVSNQGLSRKWFVNTVFSVDNPEKQYLLNSRYVVLSSVNAFKNYSKRPIIQKQYPHLQIETPTWNSRVGLWQDDYSNLISVFY